MRRPLLFSALLAAVGSLAGIAVYQLQPMPKPAPPVPVRSDYVLENFELTALNDRGVESFSVKAPHLERDPGGKSLTITKPRFAFPDRNQGRWEGSSETAWVAEKGVEVRLNKEVNFSGPPEPSGDRTRFATQSLRIFPKQDLALSDDSVTVTRADSILQGTGLRADMKAHKISLLSNVKGRYAPSRP
jgi:lipopolysaccharide export system protein LptC